MNNIINVPYDWQEKIINHKGDITIRGGRQSGKSVAVAQRIIKIALENPDGVSLITSPSERQENYLYDKVKAILGQKYRYKKRATLKLLILANGHKIWKFPIGVTGKYVEGMSSIDFLYVDEAMGISIRAWDAMLPMLAEPKKRGLGWVTMLSNTRGKPEGAFFESFQNPKFEKIHIKSDDCPHIDKEFLKEEKERMGENRYKMIYGGEFVEEDYRYFAKESLEKSANIKSWTINENYSKENKYYLGVDPARFGKCEAGLVVAELINDKVNIVHAETIKKSSMPDLMRMIERLDKEFGGFRKIFVDGGGLGGGLVDFLKEKIGIKVIEINNSEKGSGGKILKVDLYENALRLIETNRISMIKNDELMFSLSEVMYEDEKFQGKKSDLAEAFVRACWCAKDPGLKIFIA